MRVEALELTNFRSYEAARFELHPEVTLVVGPNASGKTNLLESLYVMASTKSFRAKDRELVREGEEFYRILARTDAAEYVLAFNTAGGTLEKTVRHDGVRRPLTSHVGRMQVILFEPSELHLVAGPPEGRRRYVDFLLCQTDQGYLRTLQLYRRALRQRNAVLDASWQRAGGADGQAAASDQLFAWNVKLAELAIAIYERRQALLAELSRTTPLLYRDIAGEAVQLEFEYVPSVEGDYAAEFLATLERNLPRDLAAGFTTVGPHREDFRVQFKDQPVTAVASRGEVRTLVLAMKLAELGYAETVTGIRPLLLLDDVFSELDRQRRTFLLDRLAGYQTIITTTDADAMTREFKTGHAIISTERAAV